jgi:hypothetical protein
MMINIFNKKTIYRFKTSKTLSSIVHKLDTTDRTHFNEAAVRYIAKHAKKQFRWVRKGDEYHYYLDEKHITYIDLAWPGFAQRWRQAPDKLDEISRWNPVLINLIRNSKRNISMDLFTKDLANVQPMTGPTGLASIFKARHSKGKK